MVELMHGHRLPCAEEHAVRLRGERGIAKAHQPPHAEPLPRQHTRHGVGGSGVIFQRLAQVQKAAALGHGGQAALHGGVYGAAHGGVGRQLSGVFVIETIFAIPGMGKMLVDACSLKNIPIVQGGVIFIAVIYGVINLLVDIIYGFIDPRISSIYRRKDVKKRA